MAPYLFVSFIFAGVILYCVGFFCDKESLFTVGLSLWVIGLIGVMVVDIINIYSSTEIQEPCQCEVCCKHGNE